MNPRLAFAHSLHTMDVPAMITISFPFSRVICFAPEEYAVEVNRLDLVRRINSAPVARVVQPDISVSVRATVQLQIKFAALPQQARALKVLILVHLAVLQQLRELLDTCLSFQLVHPSVTSGVVVMATTSPL